MNKFQRFYHWTEIRLEGNKHPSEKREKGERGEKGLQSAQLVTNSQTVDVKPGRKLSGWVTSKILFEKR